MNNCFDIKETELDGVKVITPFYMEDHRGYFLKNMERDMFYQYGLDADFHENIESYSKENVIRGMHIQLQNPQNKYVRVILGRVYDVAVDLRKHSPSFGRWIGIELSEINHLGLWIPAGFAHGFRVLSEGAIVSYQCTGRYQKEFDTGVKWDDPELSIDWGIDAPIVSERDNTLQSLKEYMENFDESNLTKK